MNRNLARFSLSIALGFLAFFAVLVGWAKGDRGYYDPAMFLAVFAAITFVVVCFGWRCTAGRKPAPPSGQDDA